MVEFLLKGWNATWLFKDTVVGTNSYINPLLNYVEQCMIVINLW